MGRSRDYNVNTKISWLDRLPNLLSNGTPLARGALLLSFLDLREGSCGLVTKTRLDISNHIIDKGTCLATIVGISRIISSYSTISQQKNLHAVFFLDVCTFVKFMSVLFGSLLVQFGGQSLAEFSS